ncbi:MAG: hypothetical protein JF586_12070 [Burkholderiales bacterium]|nr:hypothetical protein [Burkholderiales bacterium]
MTRPVLTGLAAFFRPFVQAMNRFVAHPPKPAPGWLCLLTPSADIVPAGELAARLAARTGSARLCIEAGKDAQWDELLLTHADWRGIARVERLAVEDDTPGARALDAMAASLAGARPAAGADWVGSYVANVKAIYVFRALPAADEGDGWEAVAAVRNTLWSRLDGILQAEGGGFTNESGCQVVWQPTGELRPQ